MESRTTPLFPLIRHVSKRVTPVLLHSQLSANQLTAMSLLFGCAAALMLMRGTHEALLQAAGLLFIAYVLDNCDGEVARARGQVSKFGEVLDDVTDWIVHTVFFIGLGYGHTAITGEPIWWWLGVVAGAGGTFNFFLAQWFKGRDKHESSETEGRGETDDLSPTTFVGWLIFAFRELARADFCFLVLILALLDGLWLLLPAGAVGAQVYWMMAFVQEARRYHV